MIEVNRYESIGGIVDRLSVCKRRRKKCRRLTVAALFALVLNAIHTSANSDSTPALQRYAFRRIEMGVEFQIQVYGCDSRAANKAATAAFDRIRDLNGVMSDYIADSEVRRLCDTTPAGQPVTVSTDLFGVLEESVSLWRDTGGAFDVTVGPVTKLWRRARRRQEMPSPELLKAALASVGSDAILLDHCRRMVTLSRREMRIDLGGIAKGHAADEGLKTLRTMGFPMAMIDASGDLVVGDPPPDAKGWRVEIAQLAAPGSPSEPKPGRTQRKRDVVLLANQAVATSGSTVQFVKIDGRHFSHIVDPRTGLGLEMHSMVTVIAPTGIQADSLASAVSVLGPKGGLQFVEGSRPKTVQVRVQSLTAGGVRQQHDSSGFNDYVILKGQ